MKSLLSLIEPSVNSHDRRFHFATGAGHYQIYSKNDIRIAALRMAALLQGQGIQKGEAVILIAGNSPFFASAFFGILYAGGIPVPIVPPDFLDREYFSASLSHVAATCQARGMICEQELSEKLMPTGLKTWATAKTESSHAIDTFEWPLPSDLALIQFSSGSTMAPKGVMLTHAALLANLQQIVDAMAVRSDEILSSWLPFYHDMGLIGGLLGVLYSDTVSYFSDPVDFIQSPRAWIEHVAKTKTSVIMGPNFLYKNLVKRVPESVVQRLDLSRLRLALCGAEPVQYKTCEKFQSHYKSAGLRDNVIFPVYGLAENCLAVTFPDLNRTFVVKHFDVAALAQGTAQPIADTGGIALVACGRPLAGVKIRIRKSNGQLCSSNEIGEIQIQSPSQTHGYFRNLDETQHLLDDGWLRTGDLGFFYDELLFVSGRCKDLMIINGKNYFPADVENHCYHRVAGVGRMAVFSNFNHTLQEEQLFVVAESKAVWPWQKRRLSDALSESIYQFTKTRPAGVYVTPVCQLPRTTSGKVRRYKLKEMLGHGQLESLNRWSGHLQARLVPLSIQVSLVVRTWRHRLRLRQKQTEIKRLTATFAEVMEIRHDKVNLQKPLAQYSLDSLKVVLLNARLKESGHEIPLGDFMQFHKLQDVVDYIEARQ